MEHSLCKKVGVLEEYTPEVKECPPKPAKKAKVKRKRRKTRKSQKNQNPKKSEIASKPENQPKPKKKKLKKPRKHPLPKKINKNDDKKNIKIPENEQIRSTDRNLSSGTGDRDSSLIHTKREERLKKKNLTQKKLERSKMKFTKKNAKNAKKIKNATEESLSTLKKTNNLRKRGRAKFPKNAKKRFILEFQERRFSPKFPQQPERKRKT